MPRRRQANRPRPRTGTPAVVSRSTAYENLPQYLTVEEVRVVLSIGRSKIYDLIQKGDIASVRFGRVVRVPKEALRGLGMFPEC